MDDGTPDPPDDGDTLSTLFDALGWDTADDGLSYAFELFLTTVPPRLDALSAAVSEGRFAEAARVGHSLRGSAGAFGAARLAALADELERRCEVPDPEAAIELVPRMEAEFASFRRMLAARLPGFTTVGDAGAASEPDDGER